MSVPLLQAVRMEMITLIVEETEPAIERIKSNLGVHEKREWDLQLLDRLINE